MNRQAGPEGTKFLSDENRRMLYGILSKDVMKRGVTLTPKLAEQLDVYLNHYVDEVYSVQGNKPVQFLNKEVLVVTAQEFNASLKKPVPAAAAAAAANRGESQQQPVVAARALGRPPVREEPAPAGADMSDSNLFMDTGSRFDALQKERMEVKKTPPPMPEFKIEFSDDGPSPLELYELAKKAREESLLLASPQTKQPVDIFVPAETRPPRVSLADSTSNEFIDAREKGIATASPNLMATSENDRKILSQQVVIKDDDVVSYREVENNLFVYSVDRDWYNNNNNADNRYNFVVNFDPANNKQGFGLSPAAQIKFKNIVRIEFVKAIIPAEGVDVLISQDASGTTAYSTNVNNNALSFPFLTLRVNEFDGNNYGTDNNLDNSFAVLQYDANWVPDSTNNSANKGFFAFIPKNLKAQRIWSPTPLATLTKLSLRLERPDGTVLNNSLDTNSVADVVGSQEATVIGTTFYTAAGAARYLFVKTSQFFSQFAVQKGDRILFQQFTATNATYPNSALQMNTYMNSTAGLLVVGIANDSTGAILTGANIVGYANYIIVEAQMGDPTTGSIAVDFFGPDATDHNAFLAGSTTYSGKLINLNRQTQFVFRVITRELDPTSRLRPDNLN
jgi:hypothetical protein